MKGGLGTIAVPHDLTRSFGQKPRQILCGQCRADPRALGARTSLAAEWAHIIHEIGKPPSSFNKRASPQLFLMMNNSKQIGMTLR